jgi:outer membrane lipoprotein SlyB
MKLIASALTAALLLTSCATPNQTTYTQAEAGKVKKTQFGRVVDIRPITIKGQNSGVGALAGGAAGAGLGTQIGAGDGRGAAIIIGALIGAIGGAMAEQSMQDQKGFDITVTLRDGDTVTVAQYFGKDDQMLSIGQRVMVQTTGDYMRVLPATHLPEKIKKPKKIEVVD